MAFSNYDQYHMTNQFIILQKYLQDNLIHTSQNEYLTALSNGGTFSDCNKRL